MATLVDLVQNLQTALTTGTNPPFSTTTCFYGFDPFMASKTPPNSQFCVIQPNSLNVKEKTWNPGPSANYVYQWHATIWLFVQLNVDETGREDSYLLNSTLGSLQLADTVITVLQTYANSAGYGYHLDDVIWPDDNHDNVGWAVTRLIVHSDLVGRAA